MRGFPFTVKWSNNVIAPAVKIFSSPSSWLFIVVLKYRPLWSEKREKLQSLPRKWGESMIHAFLRKDGRNSPVQPILAQFGKRLVFRKCLWIELDVNKSQRSSKQVKLESLHQSQE